MPGLEEDMISGEGREGFDDLSEVSFLFKPTQGQTLFTRLTFIAIATIWCYKRMDPYCEQQFQQGFPQRYVRVHKELRAQLISTHLPPLPLDRPKTKHQYTFLKRWYEALRYVQTDA